MPACIYSIKNEINGHEYIGQTKNFAKRKSKHLTALRNGYHCNAHLQKAWDKYGEENFSFSIIEQVEDYSKIGEREKFWIDKLGYYNIDKGKKGFTPKALQNMSDSHVGKISLNRKLNKAQVLEILSLDYFLDCIDRPAAKIYDVSREVIKGISHRKNYLEIAKEFDALFFHEKFSIFQKTMLKTNYDVWKNTNFSCPKKNTYLLIILKNFCSKYTYLQIGKWLGLSKWGIGKIKHEIFDTGTRQITRRFSEEELFQIVSFLLQNTTSCDVPLNREACRDYPKGVRQISSLPEAPSTQTGEEIVH